MRTSQSGWNDGQTALHFVESMMPACCCPPTFRRVPGPRVGQRAVGQMVEPEREASLKVPGLASWRELGEPGAFLPPTISPGRATSSWDLLHGYNLEVESR